MSKHKGTKVPKEARAVRDELIAELERITQDPGVRDRGEELHKELRYVSPEELLRRFTI